MTGLPSEIAAILRTCEEKGLANPYSMSDASKSANGLSGYPDPVQIQSDGRSIFVVSDLHLASGVGRDGRYEGSENFFFDAQFHRFLEYADSTTSPGEAILIINGDFVDFLRVTDVPGRGPRLGKFQTKLRQLKLTRRECRLSSLTPDQQAEFQEWRNILLKIGVDMSAKELAASIADKEDIYGMKTQSYKSVLRLAIVVKGHPEFFNALAEWLGNGHSIIVVKGNHDLEWYWLEVRNFLRLTLAERLAGLKRASAANHGDLQVSENEVLCRLVLPNLRFVDHSLIIDRDFYVEHGHRFDPLTRVIGRDTIKKGSELNLPFGSFINRYLLDFVEIKYPFLDNIRPTPDILPLMLRQKFFTGLRLLFDHVVVIFKTVPKRYFYFLLGGRRIITNVLLTAAALIVPPIAFWGLGLFALSPPFGWIAALLSWGLISYGVIQALGYLEIKEPDSLADNARDVFSDSPAYNIITFGHTHNPDQFRDQNRWFYNTGTWIPIVETSASTLRTDDAFIYLHLGRDQKTGSLAPGVLRRWNDEASRTEPVVLFRGVEA